MNLSPWLSTLSFSSSRVAGNLTVYGLRGASRSPHQYSTLDESLANGLAEVTEVSESGSVPELNFTNRSHDMVLLLAGEQLVGAKQNRVLNTSILVGADSVIKIPVSCVEQGRWRYKSRGFGSSGTSAHARLRKEMSKHVSESFFASGKARADQGKVWSEVSRKLRSLAVESESEALEMVFESRHRELEDSLLRLKPDEDWCGVMVYCHGKLAAIDCFDRPESLRKYWDKLIRGHTLDALEVAEASSVPEGRPEDWLARLVEATGSPFASPGGVGQDYRIEGPHLCGNAIVHEGVPIHLQAFDRSN